MLYLRHLVALLPVFAVLASSAPYSGTVFLYQTGGGNDPSEIALALSDSATPGVVIDEVRSNRGDYWLDFTEIEELEVGAMIVTPAERTRNNSGVGTPSGSFQATASVTPVEGSGRYVLSLHRLGSNEEYNMNISYGLFPYEEFLGGVTKLLGDPGTLTYLNASDGIELGSGKQIEDAGTGSVRVDLTDLGASSSNGILLASAAENDDNTVLVTPNDDGSFLVRTRDNNTNASDPLEQGAVSFVYVPMDQVGKAGSSVVAAGRIFTESTVSISGGEFMLTKGNTGFWYLTAPGYDISNATLLVCAIWDPSGPISLDNFVATEWNAQERCWEITSHDLPGGQNQDGAPSELMFNFALMAKEPIAEEFALNLSDAPVAREIMPHGDSLIGNGIDTSTGSFVQGRELIAVQGVRPLSFDIVYDSCFTSAMGPLGTSWRHNYEARLWGTLGRDLVVQWDAHRYSRFKYIAEEDGGYRYEGMDEDVRFAEIYQVIPHVSSPPGSWRLTLEDGSIYYFGKDGRLTTEINVAGQGIECYYDNDGRLEELHEPYSGVSVYLGYNEAGLISSVEDDLGRMVALSYDEQGRLLSVPAPFFPEEDANGEDFAATAIPDDNAEGLELFIDVSEGGAIGGIVTRALRIEHPRPGDLSITIVSPAGTMLPVAAETKEGSPTLIDYEDTFFEGFESEDRKGRWLLKVVDSRGGATGSVEAFKLSFSDSTRAVFYAYDAANRIARADDSVGETMLEAEYDAQGRIVRQADGRAETPDMTVSYVGFDGTGTRKTTYYDPLGQPWEFEHDAGFHLLKATDPLGNTMQFTYDDLGRRLSAIDAKMRTTRFTYDENGDLASMTDTAGVTTRFRFTANHQISEITDAFDRETSMLYNDGRLTVVTDEMGNTDKKEYHENGQVSKVISADNAFVAYKLDEQGRTGRISNPEYGDLEQNLNYDLAGRLIRTTDFGGNETQIFYNAAGEVRKQVDPEGNVSRWEYDNRGRLIKSVDPRGFTTTYTYDGNGNRLTLTNAIGETTRFVYDADDRLVSTINANEATTTLEYDVLGRLLAITDPLGRTTRTVYDSTGNVIRTIDPFGETSLSIEYDERDLPVRLIDSLGHVVSTKYDELMRRTETKDELGRVTTYEYDDLDRLITVTGPSGRKSKAQYQADDVMYRFQPPGEQSVSLLHDRSNNLKEIQLHSGSRVFFEYNAQNLLSRKFTAGNHQTRYFYDDAGRLEEVNPASSSELHRGYEYDAAGNLLTVGTRATEGGELTARLKRTYDPLGRLATYTDENDDTLVYLYDKASNLSGLIYPDGSEVEYSYDMANRLMKVVDWEGRETRFEWDLRDRLTRIDFPNGTYRLLNYDPVGNVRMRNDYAADGSVILSYFYSYDAAGQLQSELMAPQLEPAIPAPATYTYNSEGEMDTFDGQTVTVGRDGEFIRGPSGTNLIGLSYNVWGHLYRTSDYFHFYDDEDKLVGWEPRGASSSSEGQSFFVNPASGLSQILSSAGPGEESKRFVYGVGLLYEEDASTGDIRVFHYDHRGSAVAFSGSDGQVMGRVSYSAYGQITERTGDTDTVFLYNGMYGVVTTPEGLVHMRHRWYSPLARRFLTRDSHLGSIDQLSSMNRYTYAGGNPAMRVDPEGEFWWVAAGAAIGAVVNVGVTFAIDISDGSIDESAATYWSAAASGALSGAIIAATGGLGGAVAAGIVGSVTEDLVYAGLTGSGVDGKDLVRGAALGGAAGFAGYGAGKVVGKVSNKLYAKTFGQPGRFSKFVNKMTIPDKVSRRQGVASLGQLLGNSAKREVKDTFKGVVKGIAAHQLGVLAGDAWGAFSNLLSNDPSSGSGTGTYQIIVEANHEPNANRLRRYGEYVHYNLFLDAVRLADRPVPSHPNNTLSGF